MKNLNKTTGLLMRNNEYIGGSVIFPLNNEFLCITAGHNLFGNNFDEVPNYKEWSVFDYQNNSHDVLDCLVDIDLAKAHDIIVLKLECSSKLKLFHCPLFCNIPMDSSYSFLFRGKSKFSDNIVVQKSLSFNNIDDNNQFKFLCKIEKNLLLNDDFKSGSAWLGGWSGSGLFLEQSDEIICVGIMVEIPNQGNDGQLKFTSLQAIKDLNIGLQIENTINKNLKNADTWATKKYQELKVDDQRNLLDKLKEVNDSITNRKINSYSRQLTNGKIELNDLIPSRELSAIKYRVFHKCQTVLVDFIDNIEKAGKDFLSEEDIKQLIKDYTNNAMEIMKKKSNSFSYPYLDEDLMEKLILDLINDCYLSFDEKGIYE